MDTQTKKEAIWLVEYLEKYVGILKDRIENDLITNIDQDISENVDTIQVPMRWGVMTTVTTNNYYDILNIRVDYYGQDYGEDKSNERCSHTDCVFFESMQQCVRYSIHTSDHCHKSSDAVKSCLNGNFISRYSLYEPKNGEN